MVFLAITQHGLKEAIHLAKSTNVALWCGADAITDTEYKKLAGVQLSRFDYTLFGETAEVVQDAVDTIAEHHPRESVWVEQIGCLAHAK